MFSLRNAPCPAPCPDSTIRFGKRNIPPARLQITYLNVRSLSECLLLRLWMLTSNGFFYGDSWGAPSNCRCRNWSPGQLRSLLRPLSRWGWKCLLVALPCCAAETYRFCWGPSPPCNHPMVVSKFPESKKTRTLQNLPKLMRSRIIKTIFPALSHLGDGQKNGVFKFWSCFAKVGGWCSFNLPSTWFQIGVFLPRLVSSY